MVGMDFPKFFLLWFWSVLVKSVVFLVCVTQSFHSRKVFSTVLVVILRKIDHLNGDKKKVSMKTDTDTNSILQLQARRR